MSPYSLEGTCTQERYACDTCYIRASTNTLYLQQNIYLSKLGTICMSSPAKKPIPLTLTHFYVRVAYTSKLNTHPDVHTYCKQTIDKHSYTGDWTPYGAKVKYTHAHMTAHTRTDRQRERDLLTEWSRRHRELISKDWHGYKLAASRRECWQIPGKKRKEYPRTPLKLDGKWGGGEAGRAKADLTLF